MKCKDYDILISAYIDNEVNEKEKKAVEEHLAECENCRVKLEALQQMRNVIAHEYSNQKPMNKPKSKFYNKLYRHFFILFVGLIICFSVVALSGGVIQLYLLDDISVIVKYIYFIGIAMMLIGIFVISNAILANLFRIMKKK